MRKPYWDDAWLTRIHITEDRERTAALGLDNVDTAECLGIRREDCEAGDRERRGSVGERGGAVADDGGGGAH